MKNYVQTGDVISVPAPSDVVSGQGVRINMLFGVASFDALTGQNLELAVAGVFRLAKTSAQAWAVGVPIYATAAGLATTVATGNILIGVAIAAATNPSADGLVRLNASVPAAAGA